MLHVVLAFVVGAVLAAVLWLGFGLGEAAYIAVLGPGLLVWGLAWKRLVGFQQRCKAEALGRLSTAMGLEYQCEGFVAEGIGRLQELGLMPQFERSQFEDRFSGRRSGVDFRLYEARLKVRRGSGKSRRWVTVFGGQVILIDFHKDFLGTTVVNRNALFRFSPKGLEPVRLESNQFEKTFDVYGNDQVEARYLVHPAMMERLMELEASLGGQKLRCAFDGGELMVLVEGGDLFEVVDVLQPMPNRETTRKGVKGIADVLRLIDAVLARPANPYAAGAP